MANERQTVQCVACDRPFVPYPLEKETDEGGAYVYLECPRCATEYSVAFISPKGVELRDQLARMREGGAGAGTSRRYRRVLDQYRDEVTRASESAHA